MKKIKLSYTDDGIFKDRILNRVRIFLRNITDKGLYLEYIGNS